jgi:hypothetical protein
VSDAARRRQRGALIGLPSAAPQQLLTLLTSSFLPNVVAQVARNEGSMCCRVSACAVKTSDGPSKLTAKATSPFYSDSDAVSCGTLEAKAESSKRQLAAWKTNNELIIRAAKHFAFDGVAPGGGESEFARTTATLASWTRAGRVSSQQKVAERAFAGAVSA